MTPLFAFVIGTTVGAGMGAYIGISWWTATHYEKDERYRRRY